ncbi:MAG: M48 family peptidase, partial [Alistipes sp.]|nr:M48 family peptidase [Alistipes sp.]
MIEYNHTVLGNIFLNPTARARRLSLRMRANGEVCLSYPPTITSREALAFLEEKMPWVLRTR